MISHDLLMVASNQEAVCVNGKLSLLSSNTTTPTWLVVPSDNKHMYSISDNSYRPYTVNETTGAIAGGQTYSFVAGTPIVAFKIKDVKISESGDRVYFLIYGRKAIPDDGLGNTFIIASFERNLTTGNLTYLNSIRIDNAGAENTAVSLAAGTYFVYVQIFASKIFTYAVVGSGLEYRNTLNLSSTYPSGLVKIVLTLDGERMFIATLNGKILSARIIGGAITVLSSVTIPFRSTIFIDDYAQEMIVNTRTNQLCVTTFGKIVFYNIANYDLFAGIDAARWTGILTQSQSFNIGTSKIQFSKYGDNLYQQNTYYPNPYEGSIAGTTFVWQRNSTASSVATGYGNFSRIQKVSHVSNGEYVYGDPVIFPNGKHVYLNVKPPGIVPSEVRVFSREICSPQPIIYKPLSGTIYRNGVALGNIIDFFDNTKYSMFNTSGNFYGTFNTEGSTYGLYITYIYGNSYEPVYMTIRGRWGGGMYVPISPMNNSSGMVKYASPDNTTNFSYTDTAYSTGVYTASVTWGPATNPVR